MRTHSYAPVLSLVALCTVGSQARAYELYNENDGATVLNADLWAGVGSVSYTHLTLPTTPYV